jgi:hypothetical protein
LPVAHGGGPDGTPEGLQDAGQVGRAVGGPAGNDVGQSTDSEAEVAEAAIGVHVAGIAIPFASPPELEVPVPVLPDVTKGFTSALPPRAAERSQLKGDAS